MELSSAQAELAAIRMEIELTKALLKKAEANCGHWQRKTLRLMKSDNERSEAGAAKEASGTAARP
eukprot:1987206-Pleurochrysis_carterae.AAC.1